jgi:hypothetical protein
MFVILEFEKMDVYNLAASLASLSNHKWGVMFCFLFIAIGHLLLEFRMYQVGRGNGDCDEPLRAATILS